MDDIEMPLKWIG